MKIPSQLLLFTLTLLVPAFSRAEKPVNANGAGLAIKGYDPVAYFTDSKPVAGSKEFTVSWNGATWQFVSAAHRDLFAKDPEKHAPQYGGYCAWAVSQGHTADIDPQAWKIVEGKLYLNYNKSVQKDWEKNIPDLVAKGDANWPKILAKK